MTQEIQGTAIQSIPAEDIDRYLIPRNVGENIEDGEELLKVQTHDPHPALRRAGQTIPGEMALYMLLMIPVIGKRVVEEIQGRSVTVAAPAGALEDGDETRIKVEERVVERVIASDETRETVHLYGIKDGEDR